MKRIFSIFFILAFMLTMLAGCHGAKRKDAFVIPETFDTSREYAITFWDKAPRNHGSPFHKCVSG